MNLGAYLNMKENETDFDQIMKDNGIKIPRLRGVLLMKDETPFKEAKLEADMLFNEYCGQDDVLYIHARIGGLNWNDFGGPELEKQPWFLDKVDDPFDSTYCDIYARIKK